MDYQQINAVIRSKKSAQDPVYQHPKVRCLTFDFQNWAELSMQVEGFARNSQTVFFSCLGTTMAVAKSEEAFRKVDHDYIVEFAKMAQRSRAEMLLVVSALGADRNSDIFYNRVKGETENDVQASFSGKLHFMRPSLLLGDRKEFRFSERIAVGISPLLSPLLFGPLKKYKPIKASDVAQAMVNLASRKANSSVLVENQEIERLANS
jgi:uncharacterized protein YbjT (DUF2867 family)